MQKLKRILALLCAVLLAGMYLATLVLSLSAAPGAKNMLMAAIACTVILPCLIYGMTIVTHVLDNRSRAEGDEPEKKEKRKKTEKTDRK